MFSKRTLLVAVLTTSVLAGRTSLSFEQQPRPDSRIENPALDGNAHPPPNKGTGPSHTPSVGSASIEGSGVKQDVAASESLRSFSKAACPGDFNNNGSVDLADFLAFAGAFGTRSGDANYNALMDLDDNDAVDLSDFLAFAGVFGTTCPTPPPPSDREALVALYEATGGANWRSKTNWLSDRPLGEWHGVATDPNGRVTSLLLFDNQLSGGIPSQLGNLSNLQVLSLHSNGLSGSIPTSLGNLSNLQHLALGRNALTGSIPTSLGNLNNLQHLYLRSNALTGSVPSQFGNLSNLEILALGRNGLSGSIPSSLGNLSKLQTLELSNNSKLSGSLHGSLTSLKVLSRLDVDGTGLCAPSDAAFQTWLRGIATKNGVVNCVELVAADRAVLVALYNATNGPGWTNTTNWRSDRPLGEWYGVATDAIGRVTSLRLTDNKLSGSIPAELSNLANLQWLSLNDNQLTGSIPSELGGLSNLERLYLGGNALTGSIPSALGNLTNLEELVLNFARLTGSIPPALGNLTNLQRLVLSVNRLTGSIPSTLGNLTNLEELWLSRNQLTGSIPSTLGNMTNLQYLVLSDNQLTGSIPSSLVDLTNLRGLYLVDTRLCAPTGAAFQTWLRGVGVKNGVVTCGSGEDRAALVALYNATNGANWTNKTNWLSDRPLGEWQGVTTDVNGRVTQLTIQNNGITDVSALFALDNMTYLNLGSNNVTDVSPLSRFTNLEILNLYGNGITDVSPLSALANLTSLNLGGNIFTDSSPLSGLTKLTKLTKLLLHGAKITDISPLSGLTNLTELGLYWNSISDISPLSGLTNLSVLRLFYNKVMDVSPLSGLTNLKDLALGVNDIADVSALSGLTNLSDLSLESNDIADVSALSGLTNLRRLYLSNNRIRDLSPLSANTGLGSGDQVYVKGNPLNAASLNVHVPALQARGVTVSFDDIVFIDSPEIYNDNVFVLPVAENLAAGRLPLDKYATRFYGHFSDAFDFLVFFTSLNRGQLDSEAFKGAFFMHVSNDVTGVGLSNFFNNSWGSTGKLQGGVFFAYVSGRGPDHSRLVEGPMLHELMHRWANFIAGPSIPHWDFTSANGILGGFDLSNLVDQGGGRYRASDVLTGGWAANIKPYSPIELYLAGLIPPQEASDLWVGEDGKILRDASGRWDGETFTANRVKTYTIEDIIAEHGRRVPDHTQSQKAFRAAVILLVSEDYPANRKYLETLSSDATLFSHAGDDLHDEWYNFYEATGGRATMSMGGLSQFRSTGASKRPVARSFGTPPPPIVCHPH